MSGSTFTWLGGTEPDLPNNWVTPADWSVTGTPSVSGFPSLATDAAVVNIDDGGKDAIISSGQAITVGSLSIGGGATPPTFPAQGGHVLVGGSTTIGGGGGGTLTSVGAITITSTNTGGALVGGRNSVIAAPSMTITGGANVLVGGGGTYNIGGVISNDGVLLGDGGFFDLGAFAINATSITGSGVIGVSGPSEIDLNAATAQDVEVTVAPSSVATVVFEQPATFTGRINLVNANTNADLFFNGATSATFDPTTHTLVVNAGSVVLDTIQFIGNNSVPVSVTTPTSRNGSFEVVVGPGIPAPTPGTVTVSGLHNQYFEADNNGTLYLQDSVPNRDGVPNTAGVTTIQFADGIGVYDPTGSAEDVSRLYSATLGRGADQAGLKFWAGQIDNSHVPLSQVANDFAASPEFIQSFGTLSNADFVQRLYQNVLHRAGDPGGTAFWDGVLANGDSRGDVANSFAQSPENRANTVSTAGDVNDAESLRIYQAALGRAPDTAGQQFWSATLENGATPTQVAQGFISSNEFQTKFGALSSSDFVDHLFQNVLGRAGDQAGQNFWTNALQTGTSQASVVVAFADSLENRIRTADATHANWVFVG